MDSGNQWDMASARPPLALQVRDKDFVHQSPLGFGVALWVTEALLSSSVSDGAPGRHPALGLGVPGLHRSHPRSWHPRRFCLLRVLVGGGSVESLRGPTLLWVSVPVR